MVRKVRYFDKIGWPSNTPCGGVGGAGTVPPGCGKARAEYNLTFRNYITQWYCHLCAAELVPIW